MGTRRTHEHVWCIARGCVLGERLSLLSTGEDQHETGEVRARRFPSWPARAGPAQKAARPRGELRTLSAQGSSARSERGRIQRLLANGGRLRISNLR